MTVPLLSGVQLSQPTVGPLLVLGPSLGTSATALWSACAGRLSRHFHLVGWDLPGHGRSPVGQPFTMAELAAAVLRLVDAALADRTAAGVSDPDRSFCYAGDSAGGAVGLQLLLDAPERVRAAALLCTGARIGDPASWAERAATVRAAGTSALVTSSAQRWFAPGFLDREPAAGARLLDALRATDAEGYAQVCEVLAVFDVRARLAEVRSPVLAVAGAVDVATPPALLQELAGQIPGAALVVLDDVAHQAPAERPDEVADLLLTHFAATPPDPAATLPEPTRTFPEPVEGPAHPEPARTLPEPVEGPPHPEPARTSPEPVEGPSPTYRAGMAVRREVLGDAHVDRASAAASDFTREFQELITTYAWGTIWTRPGLDRRSRSLITLTALVARGHHEELAMHVRAARTNGLTTEEIKELLLQTAIYCGVPDANSAFRIAARVLSELDEEPPSLDEDRPRKDSR